MANQKKVQIELPLAGGGEAGNPGEDQKVMEALKRASAKFIEELRNAGIEPQEAGGGTGGYDRGSCGHDRS